METLEVTMEDKKLEILVEGLNLDLMRDFTQADGISGNEKEASRVMKRWTEGVADEVVYDNLGSIVITKKGTGNGPKVMLAGHIDEIGFLVKSIDDNGFIRLHPIGGWWGHVLPSHPVTITTKKGAKLTGLIGSKAPHGMPADVRSKVMEIKDLFVDLGVKNKGEVELLGVNIGDMVTPKSDFMVMGNPNFLAAKAWDDRIGAIIATQVLLNLKDREHVADVVAVGTVQEEVGLRGAKTAAYLVKPDVAVSLDVTIATDTPGDDNRIKMGFGVTMELADSSHLGHRGLLGHLEEMAKGLNLPVQFELLAAGGTDSGEIHKSFDGVIAVTLSIPSRYIHSHYALIHRKDVIDTITLLTEFVASLTWETVEQIRVFNR
jgi:putative aminopeptidase FrvX